MFHSLLKKNTYIVKNAKQSFDFNTYLSTAGVSSSNGNMYSKKYKNTNYRKYKNVHLAQFLGNLHPFSALVHGLLSARTRHKESLGKKADKSSCICI
jgi:hypothetical protein